MLDIGKKPLHIVGISCITSSDAAHENMGKLWAKFSSSQLKEKLDNIISPATFCVYSDYENGTIDCYRATIGYAVKDLRSIPSDLSLITIPAGKYKTFPAKSTEVADVVTVWETIWALNEQQLPRNFITDFELYDENAMTVYIGYS